MGCWRGLVRTWRLALGRSTPTSDPGSGAGGLRCRHSAEPAADPRAPAAPPTVVISPACSLA